MINALHYLKTHRKRTGISLSDMASIIGIDVGNLSKVETGKLDPNLKIAFAYHLILKIPLERLFKNHYPEVTADCLENANKLKEKLIDSLTSPTIGKRIIFLDTIIDRLQSLNKGYEN